MSRTAQCRTLLLLSACGLAACSGTRVAPRPPIFPPTAAWKTLLDDAIVEPLAASSRRVFVATRDGAVRGLDAPTGSVAWKIEGAPGRLSAAEGILLLRDEKGALTSLHPRTGERRWRTETGIAGELPAVVDGDRVLVAGQGLAALSLDSGQPIWVDGAGAPTTAPPVVAGGRVVTGEQDGTLRCRERESGRTLWTLRTRDALRAPPLVDAKRGKLYLATTDRRILEVSLERGRPGWSWRIGADAVFPGLLLPGRVLFAPYDAVLYALERGGNLAWRAPLPSRPASAPLAVEGRVVVACLEDTVVAVDQTTGALVGGFKTPTEIRAAPVLVGDLIVLGMRDRSVIAYALAGRPEPEEPLDETPRPPSPPVEGPAAGR